MARVPISQGLPREAPVSNPLQGRAEDQQAIDQLTESSLRLVSIRAAREAQEELDRNVTEFSVELERAHEEAVKSNEIDNLVEGFSEPLAEKMAERANSFTSTKEVQDQFLMRATAKLNQSRLSLSREQIVREGLRADAELANNLLQNENWAIQQGYESKPIAFEEIDSYITNNAAVTGISEEQQTLAASEAKASLEHAMALNEITRGNAKWVEDTIEDPEVWGHLDGKIRVQIKKYAKAQRQSDFELHQATEIRRRPSLYSLPMIDGWYEADEVDAQGRYRLSTVLQESQKRQGLAIGEAAYEALMGTNYIEGKAKDRKAATARFNKGWARSFPGESYDPQDPAHSDYVTTWLKKEVKAIPDPVSREWISTLDNASADPMRTWAVVKAMNLARYQVGNFETQMKNRGATADTLAMYRALNESPDAIPASRPDVFKERIETVQRALAERRDNPEKAGIEHDQFMEAYVEKRGVANPHNLLSIRDRTTPVARTELRQKFLTSYAQTSDLLDDVYIDPNTTGGLEIGWWKTALSSQRLSFNDILDGLDMKWDDLPHDFLLQLHTGFSQLLDSGQYDPETAAMMAMQSQMNDWGASWEAEVKNDDGLGLTYKPFEWALGPGSWTKAQVRVAKFSIVRDSIMDGDINLSDFSTKTTWVERFSALYRYWNPDGDPYRPETMLGLYEERREHGEDFEVAGDVGGAIARGIMNLPPKAIGVPLAAMGALIGMGDFDTAEKAAEGLWYIMNGGIFMDAAGFTVEYPEDLMDDSLNEAYDTKGLTGPYFDPALTEGPLDYAASKAKAVGGLVFQHDLLRNADIRVELDRNADRAGLVGKDGSPLYNVSFEDNRGARTYLTVPDPEGGIQATPTGNLLLHDPSRNTGAERKRFYREQIDQSNRDLDGIIEALTNRRVKAFGPDGAKDPEVLAQMDELFDIVHDLEQAHGGFYWLRAEIAQGLKNNPERYLPVAIGDARNALESVHYKEQPISTDPNP